MNAIEKEKNPEVHDALMRKPMESMARAMAAMQNEMLPYMRGRLGMHESGIGQKKNATSGDSVTAAAAADPGNLDAAIAMMDETLVLRQMEAILEQMSRHSQALADASK